MMDPSTAPARSVPFRCHGVRAELEVCVIETRTDVVKLLIIERGSSQRVSDNALAQLTEREREVLRWVAEGKRNREIATILGLSSRTVGKHLERVFEKLGVETRSAAARLDVQNQR